VTVLEQDLGAMFALRVPFVLPHVHVFRRQILNVEAKAGWRAKAGIKGQADYYAIVDGGGHIEIETKAARHRFYPEQIRWREFCLQNRIPYMAPTARKGEEPSVTVERWVGELGKLAMLWVLGAVEAE
jgi:hypothetical protein